MAKFQHVQGLQTHTYHISNTLRTEVDASDAHMHLRITMTDYSLTASVKNIPSNQLCTDEL